MTQESKRWFSFDMIIYEVLPFQDSLQVYSKSFWPAARYAPCSVGTRPIIPNKPGKQDAGASGPLPITHLKGGLAGSGGKAMELRGELGNPQTILLWRFEFLFDGRIWAWFEHVNHLET